MSPLSLTTNGKQHAFKKGGGEEGARTQTCSTMWLYRTIVILCVCGLGICNLVAIHYVHWNDVNGENTLQQQHHHPSQQSPPPQQMEFYPIQEITFTTGLLSSASSSTSSSRTHSGGTNRNQVDNGIIVDDRLRLRFDYTKLDRLSPLAKDIETVQNNCTIARRGDYEFSNGCGLGCEMHAYGIGLCSVLEMGNARFRSIGSWIYNDIERCSISSTPGSPMSCYFPHAEPDCPMTGLDDSNTDTEQFSIVRQEIETCGRMTELMGGHSNVRASTTEYLFTRVSYMVQEEGERQLNILFGKKRNDNTNAERETTSITGIQNQQNRDPVVPKNLITVHIRWGDKKDEMLLVPIKKYTDAIQQILDERTNAIVNEDDDDKVHILLATEDPEVVAQFMNIIPKHWNVYIDQYYTEMLPYRMKRGNVFNVNMKHSRTIQGRNGLIALGSLLVAMEATDYVLTTASNWSRLINELRKNIVNPRCNHCTTMIDLLYDEF